MACLNRTHEMFCLAVCPWPVGSNFTMFESKISGELFKFGAVEWRTVISFKTTGTPCREKILSSFGMTALALVVVTISTSGKRLISSTTTSSSSPDGNRPTKSAATSCHGACGSDVMIKGSGLGCVPFVAAWHERHLLTFSSNILSIWGNQTFSRSNILVLTIPWWPACASSIALLCRDCGRTSRLWKDKPIASKN